MDLIFQIRVPKLKQLDGLEFYQKVFSWGGQEYPQDPVTYRWGDHVQLIPGGAQPRVVALLPKGLLGPDLEVFDIEGTGLDLLESEINGIEVEWNGKRLDDFLCLLLRQYDRWVLVFELYEDQIDGVYELTVDECIRKLKMNLRRDIRREGFIAYRSNSRI